MTAGIIKAIVLRKTLSSTERAWFKQLVEFYLAVGRGKRGDRIERILARISTFLQFLEGPLTGTASIETRLKNSYRSVSIG